MKRKPIIDTNVFAASLASEFAQSIGLPPGNFWEPPIARHIASEVRRLGNDANARAHTEAFFRIQLGLPLPY